MKKNLLLTTFGFVKRDLNERFWIEMAPLEFNRQSTVPNFRHCALARVDS
jgi:hypothetical protein